MNLKGETLFTPLFLYPFRYFNNIEIEGLLILAPLKALCYVLEQDNLSSAYAVTGSSQETSRND